MNDFKETPFFLDRYISKAEFDSALASLSEFKQTSAFVVRTDIRNPFYQGGEHCFEFMLEYSRLPAIMRAKLPLYINLFTGSIAKRVSDSSGGKWQRLLDDVGSNGKHYSKWFNSCLDDDWYFADDDAWVRLSFNKGGLK